MPRESFSLPYPRTQIVTEVFLGKPADLSSQAAPNFHVGPCLIRRSNNFFGSEFGSIGLLCFALPS